MEIILTLLVYQTGRTDLDVAIVCYGNRWHFTFCHIWSRVTWHGRHRRVTTGIFWPKTTCCGGRSVVRKVWPTRSCGVAAWRDVVLRTVSTTLRQTLPWKLRGRTSTSGRSWLRTTGVGLLCSRRRLSSKQCPSVNCRYDWWSFVNINCVFVVCESLCCCVHKYLTSDWMQRQPTAVQAWWTYPLWEPSPSHPILV